MKKLLNSGQLGGVPIYHTDLAEVLGAEVWAALQGMLSGFDSDTEGLIISGCVFSNNAGNFDMTAGIVYLNGEFMRISAVTNQTYTKYIAPKTAVSDSRNFEDGSTQAVLQTKEAEIVASAPMSGQYITIDSLTGAEDRRFRINTGTVRLQTKVIEIGDWNMVSDSGKSVTHGLTDYTKIRSYEAIIRTDSGVVTPRVSKINSGGIGSINGAYGSVTSTVIGLNRESGGSFDSTDYDSTSYNRGWITITYEV